MIPGERKPRPTTTLQIWPTADGSRFRVTCPFHHPVPVIMRDFDADVAVKAMSAHIEIEHGWKVVGTQVLATLSGGKNERP